MSYHGGIDARATEAAIAPPASIDNAFVEQVRRDMLAFAQLQLRDAALAEDAVQDALTAALTSGKDFAGRSALKTWVFGILRHKIVDLIRQQSRTTPVSAFGGDEDSLDQAFDALFKENAHWQPAHRPAAWGDPESSLRDKHFWVVFDACLTHLPKNTARVFMMREFLELDTGEVCSAAGISTSNCHVILHRARSALRGCLEKSWFLAGERPC
ncbi:sigma-70 family RNA polymerase sigma factor [uncultured Azonexus sp.]|uniref:sigma-70 family RNA polymerase sigma factor n=1 Tax=uncultured Azonexus sp. TaxID=520307 RepID=UPI00260539D6|nr:sigma-70 family RNA polymerase sigma factor [uncultured Azonexus sp.]